MKYGKELILDIHDCEGKTFNRDDIERYFIALCEKIKMTRADLHFWDYEGCEEERKIDPDHLVGTSAVQFIQTSNITIHCLDKLRKVFVNIFSCKDFNSREATEFTQKYFKGTIFKSTEIVRE